MKIKVKDSKDLTARQIFEMVIENLQSRYPHRNIELQDGILSIDGERKFNTEGYNLLHNLNSLCVELEGELS